MLNLRNVSCAFRHGDFQKIGIESSNLIHPKGKVRLSYVDHFLHGAIAGSSKSGVGSTGEDPV